MRHYPALTITIAATSPADRADEVLAILDDYHPTAVQDVDDGLRVFFARADDRDEAAARLSSEGDLTVVVEDVPDEDWAARSQSGIGPITAGGFTITPPWSAEEARTANPERTIVVQPSMGFGTGHHASTRLCLRLLEQTPIEGRRVLDIGTGSGVLAIAATRLGARQVVAIDLDPDALENARENLVLNGLSDRVELLEHDLSAGPLPVKTFDVVLANLTGGLLCRQADVLTKLVAPGGSLIASGFQPHETDEVTSAFTVANLSLAELIAELNWVGGRFMHTSGTSGTSGTRNVHSDQLS